MSRPPTNLRILKEIHRRHLSDFCSFDESDPSRSSRIYVPIDVSAIANKLDIDPDLLFGRLTCPH